MGGLGGWGVGGLVQGEGGRDRDRRRSRGRRRRKRDDDDSDEVYPLSKKKKVTIEKKFLHTSERLPKITVERNQDFHDDISPS